MVGFQLDADKLASYLTTVLGGCVRVVRLSALGELSSVVDALKAYGYGTPVRIDYELDGRPGLRQVHGDFHPWNVLFREAVDFTALDRARGEWGDPADDVASLTLNYLFFSLQASGRLEGPLHVLFRRFWARYLARSGDTEIVAVVAPFVAFRGLVMANPMWYPRLPSGVRRKLLAFGEAVLASPVFDPDRAGEYCEPAAASSAAHRG